MLRITSSGNTDKTDSFLDKMIAGDLYSSVERYARLGVDALRSSTPRESGITAESWDYEIDISGGKVTIWWLNKNVVDGFNVAVGLQYGHGTGAGGYVQGEDYINPSLKPIFDKIADGVWEEVRKA